MRKLISIACFIFLAAMPVVAQSEAELSEKAKVMLDKLSAKNKSYSTISASFTLIVENKQSDLKQDYDGTILIKGEKYKLELMNTVTYFDGKTIYSWLKEANEVNVTESEEDESEMNSPLKMFSSYENGYKWRFIGSNRDAKGVVNEIDLYPTERNSNISRIRLTVDDNSNIKSLMQQCKDGYIYYINLTDLKTNTPIADSAFVFDKNANPKVEIIDLR